MRYQDLSPQARQILLNDYFNWEAQIAKAKSEELSSLETAKIIKSFEFLRQTLGEKFPRECLENGNKLNDYFANRAPWTRVWFSWLAEAIREISFKSDISQIIKKLKSHRSEDFLEVCSILEVGLKLVRAGFHLQFEDSILNDNDREKKPDIKVVNNETGEHIIIEVTRLTRSPLEMKYQSIMDKVHFGGIASNIIFAGCLLKHLSDEHLDEITNEIDFKLKRCIEHRVFQEIYHKDAIQFALGPADDPVLIEWAKTKEYDLNSFSFPQVDPLSRLRSKIAHKREQLSSKHPSILVIKNEDFWISSKNYESIKNDMLEAVYKCPQLFALVLLGSEMNSVEKTVTSSDFNFYVERTERHLHTSKTIMLFNRFCSTPITPHTMMRLFDAFEKH